MIFLYPLGLLGLIGVPLLILIYILRSKYNEQTVASTYLWTLSERFFKRRNPLSGLTGIISLILQILTVILVSLAIARPMFIVPASASEYCFILDGSGSMNTKNGSKTCFELAKEEIEEMIEDANLGSTYTLMLVSGDTSVVYERTSDKSFAIDMLADLECSDGDVDYSDALSKAQGYFDENSSALVYLVTDKEHNEHENVNIVNVSSQNAVNYAINDVWGDLTEGTLYAGGTVISHTTDAELNVELYINGLDKPSASTTVSAVAGVAVPVELSCKADAYDSFRLVITNADDLSIDNEVVSYNHNAEKSYSILIVSETPFFYESVFDAITDSVVDVISPDDYMGQEGYGLYVFHSYTPDELPDAAVWLINSTKSVDNSGFGIRGVIGLDTPAEIVKSTSTSTSARKLLSGVTGRDIYISEYVKYSGMYTQFTTLFSYDSHPVIFAGVNALGNRQVVFGFDIHKSDLALSSDFTPLVANLLEYSCPAVIDGASYVCGPELNINISANIAGVKVDAPNGEEKFVDTSTDVGVITLDKVGTYTVRVSTSGEEKVYRVYSAAPAGEGDVTAIGGSFSIVGEQTFEKTDGQYDPLVLIFILMAVVMTADWMVYCYEKYQLR